VTDGDEMDDEREGELILHAQQGDALAFQSLVERYMPLAWRMVLASVKDRASAEDVLQDVWLDVWRGLPRFRCGEPFRPWLVTVVANRSRKAHRRTCVEQAPLDEALAGELAWTGDVAAGALRNEAHAALRCALDGLAPDQRRILELRYFVDMNLAEIAIVAGLPLGTVKSRLHRSLHALRTALRLEQAEVRTEVPIGEQY
jgi:RNA polymerase sigma factor (sigma-70 family)